MTLCRDIVAHTLKSICSVAWTSTSDELIHFKIWNKYFTEYFLSLITLLMILYYSGLMAPEELSMLGFDGTEDKITKPLKNSTPK